MPSSAPASAALNVIASGSSCASRRPYSSPTLTTAIGRGSARKSRRFASKYDSMSPWKSRWSWLRFVKTSTREADAVEPVEDGRVRRRLHRARAVAGVEHLAERPLQVDRLGRRPHDAAPLAADPRLDRPEQPRPPTGGGEDREQEEARRRLAARAGDADDLELAGRLAEEHVRRGSHRRARVAHDDLRHGQVERALDDERDRSVLDRLRREVVAVGALAGHGEEEARRARPTRAS